MVPSGGFPLAATGGLTLAAVPRGRSGRAGTSSGRSLAAFHAHALQTSPPQYGRRPCGFPLLLQPGHHVYSTDDSFALGATGGAHGSHTSSETGSNEPTAAATAAAAVYCSELPADFTRIFAAEFGWARFPVPAADGRRLLPDAATSILL